VFGTTAETMQLQLQTWPEVDAYLRTSRGIIMPIGSTEQHGPIGLIGTDAICAEVIGRGVGEAAGALVALPIASLSGLSKPLQGGYP
jgi:creatinine amidohydrolase/Fe(II)-dependent formamide hydrolase-like protein